MGNMQETLPYLPLARFGYKLGYKLSAIKSCSAK
jgi:hypothetical protein